VPPVVFHAQDVYGRGHVIKHALSKEEAIHGGVHVLVAGAVDVNAIVALEDLVARGHELSYIMTHTRAILPWP
jgi:hypothetical protein